MADKQGKNSRKPSKLSKVETRKLTIERELHVSTPCEFLSTHNQEKKKGLRINKMIALVKMF